jgi:hypothetical protein
MLFIQTLFKKIPVWIFLCQPFSDWFFSKKLRARIYRFNSDTGSCSEGMDTEVSWHFIILYKGIFLLGLALSDDTLSGLRKGQSAQGGFGCQIKMQ